MKMFHHVFKRVSSFFSFEGPGLLIFLSLLFLQVGLNAQTGYIYIHTKSLNESESVDFSYTVSGGATSVPGFVLNDNPAQIPVLDIGAAENGRLWAVSRSNVLYYREANSSVWVNTSIGSVSKVDGGAGGDCYYLNTSGTMFHYTGSGPGTTTRISGIGQFSNAGGWNDLASGWTSTPSGAGGPAIYAVRNDNLVYQYSGNDTSWNTYVAIVDSPAFTGYRMDVNPVNGMIYIAGNSGLVRSIRSVSTALAMANLGTPLSTQGTYRDIAVNQNGEVYVTAYTSSWYVHKYGGGTSWATEFGSFDGSNLTGGVGNSLWLTMNSGGHNGTVPSYPFYNMFTRAFDGTNVTYVDDERVRTTVGNSQLIPVVPGTYTISESIPAGWDLQKIFIYDPSANSSSNQAGGAVTLNVAAGEVVEVVFQNGVLNAIAMTNSCGSAYLETFGSGPLGSFGAAVSGQTSYHYLAGNAPGEDGHYKIVNRANPDFNTWGSAMGIIDHTPGDADQGYMYAVNAGFDRGEFFRRRFTGVVPGATYNFSAWIVDLTANAPVNPNVSFTVFDHATQTVLGSYNTGQLLSAIIPGSWQQFGFSFVASASDIDLVMGNNGLGGNGNDLAIDDISFSLVAPSAPVTTIINLSCGTAGTVSISSPLGASYQYSIDSLNWQSSPVFSNLSAGIYSVYARFLITNDCVSSKVDTVLNSICGTVFNDVNGNTVIDPSELGTTAGTSLYVYLVNAAGIVVDSAQVAANGTYSLSALPNSTYTLELSAIQYPIGTNVNTTPIDNSAVAGWVSTGENGAGNTGSGDGNADGVLTVSIGSAGFTNANFGIQQPPTAISNIFPTQINPGDTLSMIVPSSYFEGTDPAGGYISSLTITSFPNNVNSLTVNGVVYTAASFPVGGLIIPTDSNGHPLQTIAVDPVNGNVTSVITYVVTDNAGSVSQAATVQLSFSNDVPTANSNTALVPQNGTTTISVLTNDTFGADGPATGSISIISPASHGTSLVDNGGTPNDPTDDQISYTPNSGFYGYDTLIYQICDVNGDCDTAMVYITVEPQVIAEPDINQTLMNVPVVGTVATNDQVPGGSLFTPLTSMNHGTIVFNTDGSYTYTPDSSFTGTDSMTYVVCSPAPFSRCDTTVLSIVVSPAYILSSNTITVQNDYSTTPLNTPVLICVVCNDSDPQGDSIGMPMVLSNPANGVVTLNPDGTITYTPNNNFSGNDQFTYVVCDNGTPSVCDTATVFVYVPGITVASNQTYANDDAYTALMNTSITDNIGLNDTDPQNDSVSFTLVSGTLNGTVALDPNGNFVYTPNLGYAGTDYFIYSKCDDGTPSVCDTATVYINIVNPNAALPAILERFAVFGMGCNARVEWEVSQEINVARYEIQRRSTNSAFATVGYVSSKKGSSQPISYSYLDEHLNQGTYEYRLKTVDTDESFVYSGSSLVSLKCSQGAELTLYPNPTSGNTNLLIQTESEATYSVRITDAVGRVIYQTAVDLKNEVKLLELPLEHVAVGIYTVTVSNGETIEALRVMRK